MKQLRPRMLQKVGKRGIYFSPSYEASTPVILLVAASDVFPKSPCATPRDHLSLNIG